MKTNSFTTRNEKSSIKALPQAHAWIRQWRNEKLTVPDSLTKPEREISVAIENAAPDARKSSSKKPHLTFASFAKALRRIDLMRVSLYIIMPTGFWICALFLWKLISTRS